jgi:hypothetical protein
MTKEEEKYVELLSDTVRRLGNELAHYKYVAERQQARIKELETQILIGRNLD